MEYGKAKTLSMVKLAKTRQVKEMERLFRAGRLDEANALARRLQDAGVLKVTQQGTQLKELGAGAEGLAHAVVGARDRPRQITVRKMYDPKGQMWSPGAAQRKIRVGELAEGERGFAQIYTKRKPRGGADAPYMLKEYVAKERGGAAYNPEFQRSVKRVEGRAAAEGMHLRDVLHHRDNVRMTPSGQMKAIDFIADNEKRLREAGRLGPKHYYPNLTPDAVRKLNEGLPYAPGDITKSQQLRLKNSLGGGSRQKRKVRGSKADEAEAIRSARRRMQAKRTAKLEAARPTPGPAARPTPGPAARPTPGPAARPTPRPTPRLRRPAAVPVRGVYSSVPKFSGGSRARHLAAGTALVGGLGLAGYLAHKRKKKAS